MKLLSGDISPPLSDLNIKRANSLYQEKQQKPRYDNIQDLMEQFSSYSKKPDDPLLPEFQQYKPLKNMSGKM